MFDKTDLVEALCFMTKLLLVLLLNTVDKNGFAQKNIIGFCYLGFVMFKAAKNVDDFIGKRLNEFAGNKLHVSGKNN